MKNGNEPFPSGHPRRASGEQTRCIPRRSNSTPIGSECSPEELECVPEELECPPQELECVPAESECSPSEPDSPAGVHSGPATGPGEGDAGYAPQPAFFIDSRTIFTLGWFSSKCLRKMAKAFLKLAQAAAFFPSAWSIAPRLT